MFSFVVEIQPCKSSEVKNLRGGQEDLLNIIIIHVFHAALASLLRFNIDSIGYFRVPKTLTSKRGSVQNLSGDNELRRLTPIFRGLTPRILCSITLAIVHERKSHKVKQPISNIELNFRVTFVHCLMTPPLP